MRGVTLRLGQNSFVFDCALPEGAVIGVTGASGAGKSTFLNLLAGFDTADAGQILFKGKDLLKMSKAEKRSVRGNQISMIFQEPMTSLNPVYRIKDQIMESIMTHMKVSKKEALKRTIEMLEIVGIPSAEKRAYDYPHQMSGGMRQRVMIAMALIGNPELLIADEPTTALDVTIQAQILDLLYHMREKFNMAVMLITHDLGVVSEAADHVIVMYCGKIVEEADVRSLFENPLHPYTLGLLRSIPRLEDENDEPLYMIKGMVPNPLNMPAGCPFSDRCDSCMDRCRKEMPQLVEKDGHKVRCFLYEDERQGGKRT
ncbi:ABC transporter ATP-binding protein, partial [Ruminiclostridium cellobioparum]|uniref:ABC transporter ATP-binding protein n=1 Tax=Ruminiclostridium cellobioparum TaxID=29355 RepID=UPI0028A673AD